jgi:hypothetical protein
MREANVSPSHNLVLADQSNKLTWDRYQIVKEQKSPVGCWHVASFPPGIRYSIGLLWCVK